MCENDSLYNTIDSVVKETIKCHHNYKLVVIFAYNSFFNLLLKTNNYLFQN